MDVGALRGKLAAYLPPDRLAQVDAAYTYSESAHSGQTRASGKPYISHPVAVADILADWRSDAPSIVAALLHDVVEDTAITLEQIRRAFGGDIARMVDGLSKIERLYAIDRNVREAENFRKLLLAAAADWRVVFIKLADRLHNMRTLAAIPSPAKRKAIAGETLEIYAPIARRLGISKVQEELQNLAFRHLHPYRFRTLKKALGASAPAAGGRAALDAVETAIREGMARRGINCVIRKRQKNLYSIYRKMERNQLSFAQVEDIIGFRLIVEDRAACYQTLGALHELFVPMFHRFRDFIAIPKTNGYQSLHTGLVSRTGVKIDAQIRTQAMDEVAEHGLAAHWLYKDSAKGGAGGDDDDGNGNNGNNGAGGNAVQADALKQLSSLVRLHAENEVSDEFMENIKIELFPADMLVITPKGKIITLPKGASAIDMAYAIHTEVGDHAERAIINGKPMPMAVRLNSGDQVEIITSPEISPLPHWLSSVKTARARSRIRHVLQDKRRGEAAAVGKKMLANEMRRLDPSANLDDIDGSHWRAVIGGNNFKSRHDLFRALGLGELLPEIAARMLLRRRVKGGGGDKIQPVLIAGAGKSAIQLSPCCHPLPPEPIVGMLRKERGLIIHTASCPAVSGSARRSERWIDVQWSDDAGAQLYSGALRLHCYNRPGLIAAVSDIIGKKGINIITCNFDGGVSAQDSIYMQLVVEVNDLPQLEALLQELSRLPETISVSRPVG